MSLLSLSQKCWYRSWASLSICPVSPPVLLAMGFASPFLVFLASLGPSPTLLASVTSLASRPFSCTPLLCRAIVMGSFFSHTFQWMQHDSPCSSCTFLVYGCILPHESMHTWPHCTWARTIGVIQCSSCISVDGGCTFSRHGPIRIRASIGCRVSHWWTVRLCNIQLQQLFICSLVWVSPSFPSRWSPPMMPWLPLSALSPQSVGGSIAITLELELPLPRSLSECSPIYCVFLRSPCYCISLAGSCVFSVFPMVCFFACRWSPCPLIWLPE